jgi:multiple sugar transport system ATP-binding protein
MATVTFDHLTKTYTDGVTGVHDLELLIKDGEFLVLVGPSGCGKTTALRCVAGLEEITSGAIKIGERIVNRVPSKDRDIAMVFQSYALYPHMTVFENLAFGLKLLKTPKQEIRRRVEEAAKILNLEKLLDRKPKALSGGQRQRVALGRAIVREPSAFLMDEPLSNLDAKLRVQTRAEILRIQRRLGTTTIYVTHDQVEAMTMGDRVAVMRKGELQQVDAPQELYDRPANLFVASFIGSPSMNLVQGRLERRGDAGLVVRFGDQELTIPPEVASACPELSGYVGKTVGVGIRPEHVRQASAGEAESTTLGAKVIVAEALGSEQLVHLEIAAEPIVTSEVVEVVTDVDAAALEDLRSEARERRSTLLARLETGVRAFPGDSMEVAVNTAKLHFFDLDTGTTIGRLPRGAATRQ